MPVVKSAVGVWIKLNDAGWRGIGGMVKEQQFNRITIFREDTEIDTVGVDRCTQGKAATVEQIIFHRRVRNMGITSM